MSSSESNGRRPESQEPGPASGTGARSSARAPSAWGATRDALAAVHNLVALLRSGSVLYRTIRDLLPELRTSAGVLREAFERARGAQGAPGAAGTYGAARVDELDRLLEATNLADEERDDLADRARMLADELEASADLLALLERAASRVATEVSAQLVVRSAARTSGSARGRELPVRFDPPPPECTVLADPHVLGPLLSLMIARLHAAGVQAVVVRGGCDERMATFEVRPATARDASLPETATRILPAVPPTDAAIRQVAQDVGATTLELEDHGARFQLPRHVG
jgi:hypothetical protein